jgi:hypothetical protein
MDRQADMSVSDDDWTLDLFDGDEETAGESASFVTDETDAPARLAGVRIAAWRRIELLREQRMLRADLEDFDEYAC